jgi:cyclopropane-fatty-acyl-phospholipid synthase
LLRQGRGFFISPNIDKPRQKIYNQNIFTLDKNMSNTNNSSAMVRNLLGMADVTVNGSRPWDAQVSNEKFYSRVLRDGSMGLGESYMDGWWDATQLDEFFNKILSAELDSKVKMNWKMILLFLTNLLSNRQSKSRAFKIGEHHYDLGNDLYEAMLDKRMVYTCGYWKNAKNLDEAQEAKLDLTCKKLNLSPGMKILDIGCGWGSFAKYAAEKYGVSVVGVTVSKEQAGLARDLCQGLPVEIVLRDYRAVEGMFDRVVSLGMIEHVGYKNYRTYMSVAREHLKDKGIFLLHTIGCLNSTKTLDPWIERYIFPNSMLPSMAQLTKAVEGLFVIEDLHNFGTDYDKTLMAWFENFNNHWGRLKERYGDRFYRMWKYYLLACAGSFRARNNQLWQIVLSKGGIPGGYTSREI